MALDIKNIRCFAFGLALAGSLVSVQTLAQDANPLDRFRVGGTQNNANTQQAQPSRTQQIGTPAPTIGGFQQDTLSQAQINDALQGYDFAAELDAQAQKEEIERQAREAAFEAALTGMFPMEVDEVLQFLERYRENREATQSRIGGVPTPRVSLETVSLDPGAVPPTIKVSPGHVTTLNIVDVTGEPWPVRDVSWGGDFEVIQPQEGEHVIRISPMRAHEVGNLSIQLVELKTPITFTLITQLEEVQYRMDAQIPEYGPNSRPPLIDQGITTVAGGADITSVLDGTPPPTAKKLDIDGVDGRTTAFQVNNQVFVRTPLTLLSPGWSSSVTSADGTTVYAIGKTPVLLLSERGKMVRAVIEYN